MKLNYDTTYQIGDLVIIRSYDIMLDAYGDTERTGHHVMNVTNKHAPKIGMVMLTPCYVDGLTRDGKLNMPYYPDRYLVQVAEEFIDIEVAMISPAENTP